MSRTPRPGHRKAGPEFLTKEEQRFFREILSGWEMYLRPDRRWFAQNRTNVAHTTIGWIALHDAPREVVGLYPLPSPVPMQADPRENMLREYRVRMLFWHRLDYFLAEARQRETQVTVSYRRAA